ncbi:adenylate/guanylate cyclase domain-containing protein [Falsiroseomonas selenitidurans]|uniref:HAMP domain-containing protein n=1 Tax=Falsiroseomonas selenitidurans TaxID=2716335 RepID=A0ABX1E1Z5_9PROT|nr:adenylate/guanylate cyclase domain-containing protein [Falsiroseomonas selenitidurans]NKC31172.1 HAMP domain-containing protein [Falsiroseomonas selenitidurans]
MRPPFRISFTMTVLGAFALLFVAAVGVVVSGYRATGARAALDTAARSLAQAAETAVAGTGALIRPVVALSTVMPEFAPLIEGSDPAARDIAALVALLGSEPAVQVVSVGLGDGSLRQVARAAALRGPSTPPVPEGTAFALRDIRAGESVEVWTFLDATLQVRHRAVRPAQGGDPRQAQWYLQARDEAVHISTLYDLPLVGSPGLSVSRRVPGTRAVFALDITLERLADFLARLRASPDSVLFLFTEDGILLAHQQAALAAPALGEGRTGWTTMAATADPLLQRVWRHYAQGMLLPGTTTTVEIDGAPMLVRLTPLEGLAAQQVVVAVAAPVADFTAPVDAAIRDGTVLAGLALVAGLLSIGLLAWRISRPLGVLTHEAEAIRRLELDAPVAVRSHITEIARLAGAMDGMKSALRLFGAYVPRSLVGRLMEEGATARLGGEKRPISVMFSDVEGFTTLAEGIAPEELMHITSDYFEALTGELLRAQATIDKYIGDAVMALWNAPQDDPAHAEHACRAALRSRHLTDTLCESFAARGWPRLRTRFGLHTGEAVVGNVGSSDRMSYTAIGSMVNLASRLEGMNKFYGTRILISEATRAAAGPGFVTRPVDLVLAKGAAQPIALHELLGLAVGNRLADAPLRIDPGLAARLPAWHRMIAAYRAARFEEAAAALAEAVDDGPDPLATLYAERLAALRAGPPADWSPVLRFTTK